uniref:Uncharacterized protein n=1 Tax=Plectus sambesii TaxID=2011161 RepID=A0A914W9Y5_9BILA
HCKVKLTCKDGKYVSNGLSAKQLKEVHCGCKPKLVSLTEEQVVDFLTVFTGIEKSIFASFGDVEFIPRGNGFVVTCQCAGAGDTCYLDLGKNFKTFTDLSAKFINSVNKGGKGEYDLLTSAFISCDENGNNQLVDENGEKVPIGMYSCISEYQPFLAFEGLNSLVSPSTLFGAKDWPIVIEANESSPLSVNIVCACDSSTKSCVLDLSGAYSRTKNQKGAEIKSPKIIVDANGKFKVEQSTYGSGGAFYKIKCYST